jgi:hypothetical protein
MIPRPDATGLTFGFCDGEDQALGDLFLRNGLCVQTGDPEVINAMTPADALAISHALHGVLRFQAVDHGEGLWDVAPARLDDDLAAACSDPAVDLGGSADACAFFEGRASGGECTDIYMTLDEEGARAFADALNQLYGID